MSYAGPPPSPRCDECPLKGRDPVMPELRPGCRALLVGEAPGEKEEAEGRPFVGPSGLELQRALGAVGVRRSQVSITNAILCRPPDNDLAKLLHKIQGWNKLRKRDGEPLVPTPIECCKPRLDAELASHLDVVALGGTAMNAVLGGSGSILEARGGPVQLADGHRILPTLHPAFVMRARRWTQAFTADLGRAFRWFEGKLRWRDPVTTYAPTPAQLEAWLRAQVGTPFVVYDVETAPAFPKYSRYEPTLDPLRCVGLCSHDGATAVVVPFLSVEQGVAAFYTAADERAIRRILKAFFSKPAWRKATWNGGYYDRMVVEHVFGVTPTPHVDGIGLHKMVEPELPHRLGYAGSIYTDVSAWKQGHVANTAERDLDLWRYNATDCAVTALTIGALIPAVKNRGQTEAARFWPKVQDVCVGLHKAGLYVDQDRRRVWDQRLLLEAKAALSKARTLVGDSEFNPGSTLQLRGLLFDKWELLPHDYTALGDPSTDDASLRAFLMQDAIDASKKETIRAIRTFREKVKLRGTYVTKLRPQDEPEADAWLAWDDEETKEEREKRRKKQQKRPGIVLDTGRFYPDYNAHGTVGWRLSSSNPNAQNFPDKLREIVVAEPGRVLVGCDQAQLELRFVAALAGCAVYLEAFAKGEDPHLALCLDFFGDTFKAASKDQKKKLRVFVKQFTYASLYRAAPEMIHQILTSSEDDDGNLLYPTLTVRETTAFHTKWLARNPEIEKWWESDLEEFRTLGYLAEPIFGLRRDFLDGEAPNEIANYKAQSGGSALVHVATDRLLQQIPFEAWGPGTGLVTQTHDSLVVECPEAEGPRVAKILEECMTLDGNRWGLPVPFLGEAKIGHSWKEV